MTTFDAALAEEAFEDDLEGLAAFLRSVLASLESGVQRVREAASKGDAPTLRAAAHAVKGSSGHLGADEVGEVAAKIENAAREGHIESAQSIEALEGAVATLQKAVEDYLVRRSASS